MKSKFILAAVASLLLAGCANSAPTSEVVTTFEVTALNNPDKVKYIEGDYFDPTGLAFAGIIFETKDGKVEKQTQVEVSYTNNRNDLTFNPSLTTPLTTDMTKVSVTYKNYTEATFDINITVTEPIVITSIVVDVNPTKTAYSVGEYFDPTGLEISVNMTNDLHYVVKYEDEPESFSFSPSLTTPLTINDEKVTVTYEEKTADISISVSENLETLVIDFNAYQFQGSTLEISTSNVSSYEDALKAYINTEDTYLSGIITSGYSGLKRLDYSSCSIDPFNILQLSSGTSSSTLTLKFAKTIKTAKIRAQAYYKAWMKTYNLGGNDPYPVFSIDADTTISVNGEEWELPSCEYNDNYEIVSMPTIEQETFTINSKNLVLDDIVSAGRVFFHSIELTF